MSETIPSDPLAVANAIEVAETKLVGQVVRIARNPKVEPDAIRTALEHLDPADQIRIGDRVADILQQQGRRTGQFETLERALPFLPGQSSQVERQALEAAAQQQQPLGLDASLVHQALAKVLEDRQPNAADVPGLKDYAAQALKDREQRDGPIVLPPDIPIVAGRPPPVHSMDQMAAMVRQVQDRVPGNEDRITLEQAVEVRQSLEGQFAGVRTLRELNTLRWQEDVERSMAAVARHPEQRRLMDTALEAAETRLWDEKLRSLPSRQTTPEPDAAPSLEISRRDGMASVPNVPDPPIIASQYLVREVRGEREYYQREDGQLAMRANDDRIQGMLRDTKTIGAMLDLAMARGWNDVQIRGDRETARDAWIEATARGLRTEGYRPTRDDVHAMEQRRLERQERGLDTVAREVARPEPAARVARVADRDDAPGESATERAMPDRGSRSSRADTLNRDAWIKGRDGFDALPPRQQEHAERSYKNWAAANPELGAKHNLADYTSYVQQREHERQQAREDRARDRDDDRSRPARTPDMPSLGA